MTHYTNIDRIYKLWKNNKGYCEDCPFNDKCNHYYPLYGLGKRDADVFVVADTPAYNIEGISKRKAKDNCDKQDNSYKDFSEFNTNELQKRLKSNKNVLVNVLKYLTYNTNYSVNDLYFTNIKKCGDYPVSSRDKDKGYKTCSKYIPYEIKDVNPKIIITVGANPFKYINKLFGLTEEKSILKNHLKTFRTKDYTILSLAHWGYFNRNNKMQVYLKDINETFKRMTNETFDKEIYNNPVYVILFQEMAEKYVKGEKIAINKIKDFNSFTESTLLNLEKINEQQYTITDEVQEYFGELMAKMHNFGFKYNTVFNKLGNTKSNIISFGLDRWNTLKDKLSRKNISNKEWELFNTSYELRNNIISEGFLEKTDRLIESGPLLKIPVHRDLRPHNIIFDGTKYQLIDFEFAAVDLAEIELGRFILDLIINGNNTNIFVKSYYKNLNEHIREMVNIKNVYAFTAKYLIGNTFPHYTDLDPAKKESITKVRNNHLKIIKTIIDGYDL